MRLIDRERETYEMAWGLPQYAEYSPGEARVPVFLEMAHLDAEALRVSSFLDAGCGAGKGALALERAGARDIRLCDLTDVGLLPAARRFRFSQVALWDDLSVQVAPGVFGGAFDYVYCCDVMEHIPTAYTMLVVARLLAVTRTAAFFSISLQQDVFGNFVGGSLHQTVQSFVWWREHLHTVGTVLEARDLLSSGVYLVKP